MSAPHIIGRSSLPVYSIMKNLYFEKDVEWYFVKECLVLNEMERWSNVMDFGTCVANEICL